jgi:TonB-dependent receptor
MGDCSNSERVAAGIPACCRGRHPATRKSLGVIKDSLSVEATEKTEAHSAGLEARLFGRERCLPLRPGARRNSPFHLFSLSPLRAILGMLLLLSLVSTVHAQDGGAVTGVVVSTWDGNPLTGVTVTVRGTTLAAQTDASGKFELKNVPPGDQVLRFSRSGYAAAMVTDVRVLLGQTTTVNGNLRPEFYEMEEFEVTAEEFSDQTSQILLERKESSALMDGVGADFISRVGAGDAAEALGKVSGASIADGKFAVIRGLADRYTTTTLNGNELPSADPDRKAAQLDLLPTQIIERMDVAKTFSPDMAGGFAGGSINIVTKSFPEQAMASFSFGLSYNTQANLNDDFLVSDQSSTDWLARDDGKRALPAIAKASSPRGTSGAIQNEAEVERSFGSSQLGPLTDRSPLNSSMSLSVGDSFNRGDFRFGYLGSLGYKNDYKFYEDGDVRKYDRGDIQVQGKSDTRAVVEYNWAASAAVGLSFKELHELKFNFLYVAAAEDEARRLRGFDEETQEGTYVEQNLLHWTERSLTYFQLAGAHQVPEWNELKLDWAGSLATTTQDEPDYRIFQFIADPANSVYQPFGRSEPAYPTRYWRELEENNQNWRADLTMPLPSYNDKDNSVKFGGAFSDSQRDYFQRGFTMYPQNFFANTFVTSGNPQDYLDPVNYPHVQYRNFPANLTYRGEQLITAGYLMADWAVLNRLRLTGGARLERTDLSLTGFDQTRNGALTPGSIQQDDVLPSLAATFSLNEAETVLLRGAWSQTVVRPAYREIAPVAIYDIAQARQYSGNPNLVIAESANYDLRLEWFPRAGEVVSVSVFRKDITLPIEQSAIDNNNDRVSYLNYEEAEVLGVEFEVRAGLDRLWQPLEEFTLGCNVAYIESEVPLTSVQQANRSLLYGETANTRPLYDQPEYVFNTDLTWDHKATGTTFTISGGVVGRRLIVVGLARPDEYEEPAPQLDVFLSQKIGKHWKLKLSAKNLLDPAFEVKQDWGTTGETTVKSYTKGMTFGVSLGCEF